MRQHICYMAQISIHAPREGSDLSSSSQISAPSKFLSTLPVRGATSTLSPAGRWTSNVYPRSP